jgi:hypothetical protein
MSVDSTVYAVVGIKFTSEEFSEIVQDNPELEESMHGSDEVVFLSPMCDNSFVYGEVLTEIDEGDDISSSFGHEDLMELFEKVNLTPIRQKMIPMKFFIGKSVEFHIFNQYS